VTSHWWSMTSAVEQARHVIYNVSKFCNIQNKHDVVVPLRKAF
jgi:hypothetical protein